MPLNKPRAAQAQDTDTDVAEAEPIITLTECQAMIEPALMRAKAIPIEQEIARQHLGTRRMVSSVLDAFLHKTLFDDLRQKGIYLLPTPKNFGQKLELNLIDGLITGEAVIPAVSDIRIEGGQVHPVVPEKPLFPTQGLQYIVHPLRLDNNGYGLLVIDFANQDDLPSKANSAGAYYFAIHEDNLRDRTKFHELNLYLTQISIPYENIKIKYLTHKTSDNSAEYVIALLQALAAPSFHLRSLHDLDILDGAHCEDTIPEYIRLSQIRLFGPQFYWFQQEGISPALRWYQIYQHLKEVFPQMNQDDLQTQSFDLEEKPGSSSPHLCSGAKRRSFAAVSSIGQSAKTAGKSLDDVLAALQKLHFQRQAQATPAKSESVPALDSQQAKPDDLPDEAMHARSDFV